MGNATGGKFSADGAPTSQQPMASSMNVTAPVQGANGVVTNSATSGQPTIGAANQYSNTVGQWDNAVQQPNQSMPQRGN